MNCDNCGGCCDVRVYVVSLKNIYGVIWLCDKCFSDDIITKVFKNTYIKE